MWLFVVVVVYNVCVLAFVLVCEVGDRLSGLTNLQIVLAQGNSKG